MEIRKALSNSWRYLPFGSFINYTSSLPDIEPNRKKINRIRLTCLAHIAYAAFAVTAVGSYFSIGTDTNEWNPLKQRKALQELRLNQEQEKIRKQELVDILTMMVDENHDGLDIDEKFRAYKAMGLGSEIRFPEVSIKDLEKGIVSYGK